MRNSPLELRRELLGELSTDELGMVAGGSDGCESMQCPTVRSCARTCDCLITLTLVRTIKIDVTGG